MKTKNYSTIGLKTEKQAKERVVLMKNYYKELFVSYKIEKDTNNLYVVRFTLKID